MKTDLLTLLISISQRSNSNSIRISQDELASQIGIDPRNVRRNLNLLQSRGLIKFEKEDYHSKFYTIEINSKNDNLDKNIQMKQNSLNHLKDTNDLDKDIIQMKQNSLNHLKDTNDLDKDIIQMKQNNLKTVKDTNDLDKAENDIIQIEQNSLKNIMKTNDLDKSQNKIIQIEEPEEEKIYAKPSEIDLENAERCFKEFNRINHPQPITSLIIEQYLTQPEVMRRFLDHETLYFKALSLMSFIKKCGLDHAEQTYLKIMPAYTAKIAEIEHLKQVSVPEHVGNIISKILPKELLDLENNKNRDKNGILYINIYKKEREDKKEREERKRLESGDSNLSKESGDSLLPEHIPENAKTPPEIPPLETAYRDQTHLTEICQLSTEIPNHQVITWQQMINTPDFDDNFRANYWLFRKILATCPVNKNSDNPHTFMLQYFVWTWQKVFHDAVYTLPIQEAKQCGKLLKDLLKKFYPTKFSIFLKMMELYFVLPDEWMKENYVHSLNHFLSARVQRQLQEKYDSVNKEIMDHLPPELWVEFFNYRPARNTDLTALEKAFRKTPLHKLDIVYFWNRIKTGGFSIPDALNTFEKVYNFKPEYYRLVSYLPAIKLIKTQSPLEKGDQGGCISLTHKLTNS